MDKRSPTAAYRHLIKNFYLGVESDIRFYESGELSGPEIIEVLEESLADLSVRTKELISIIESNQNDK